MFLKRFRSLPVLGVMAALLGCLLFGGGLVTSGCESPKNNATQGEPKEAEKKEAQAPEGAEAFEEEAVASSDRESDEQPAAENAEPTAAPATPPTESGLIGRDGGGELKKSYKKSEKRKEAPGAPMLKYDVGRARVVAPAPADEPTSTEEYKDHGTNPWFDTMADNLSTFAIDVDTASYTIARRKIEEGSEVPPASVRVEEFVNYFHYNYAQPTNDLPFAVNVEMAPSPFTPKNHIVRVGVQGKAAKDVVRKRVHLTLLVDVSGSMSSEDKLGLAKKALRLLTNNLGDEDTIALVTYAGATKVVLQPTPVKQRMVIHSALEELTAGGGTAMGTGLQLAYQQASESFEKGAINRVIVISDGDANIGTTDHGDILSSIGHYVDQGITLSTIGVGNGNYKDERMEQLANKGNGNYYYFDTLSAAKRVFQEQIGSTLQVIAKDVKIQVEFDKEVVEKYRLIGYENRDIADADFRNDKVDAGEIGAGHSVTALYEVKLRDGVKGDLGTVRIRHKEPEGTEASENAYSLALSSMSASFDTSSDDLRFAFAVASLAEFLRKSQLTQTSLADIRTIAQGAIANDSERQDLVALIDKLNKG